MQRHFLTVFLFAFFAFAGRSHFSKNKIDSLLFDVSLQLKYEGKYDECIGLNFELIKHSKAIKYKDGIAFSYLMIGASLSDLHRYKESLKYLNQAKFFSEFSQNFMLKGEVAIEIGRIYNDQRVSFDRALVEFKRAESYAGNIKDEYDRETVLLYSYISQSSAYNNLMKFDSAYYYALKAFQIQQDYNEINLMIFCHLNTSKNIDSLDYYFSIVDSLSKIRPPYYYELAVLNNYRGEYFFLLKDYRKAIEYFKSSLVLSRKHVIVHEELFSLLKISKCYELLGDAKKSLEFFQQHSRLSEKINSSFALEAGHTIENIINEQKSDEISKNWVVFFIVVGFFVLVVLVFLYLKYRIKSKTIVVESSTLLHEKDIELHEIKQMVNLAFSELVELASLNHPNFYTRFNEVYPHLQEKLLNINQNLLSSELLLCAYIYLDFQTKEIATIWFKSIRTIQNRKNSLRKKLNLSSSDDIYVWIKSL